MGKTCELDPALLRDPALVTISPRPTPCETQVPKPSSLPLAALALTSRCSQKSKSWKAALLCLGEGRALKAWSVFSITTLSLSQKVQTFSYE